MKEGLPSKEPLFFYVQLLFIRVGAEYFSARRLDGANICPFLFGLLRAQHAAPLPSLILPVPRLAQITSYGAISLRMLSMDMVNFITFGYFL